MLQTPMNPVANKNRRILVVDDNKDIHNDFLGILGRGADTSALDGLEASLFGKTPAVRPPEFELTSAYQGAAALEEVRRARRDGTPYALAFMDMRMPPGWDGVETLSRIWQEDDALQAVICSAYSDCSWGEMVARLGQTDRLLILKKPFDPIEVRQMACALTEKWNQHRAMERSESALRKSEAEHRGLVDALPDTLLRIGRDGTCLDCRASSNVFPAPLPRFSANSSIGDTLPGDVARQIMRCIEQATRENAAQIVEYEQRLGGELRHFEARVVTIDADEALVILRDLTEQKRAAAAAGQKRVQEETILAQAAALSALSMPLLPIADDIVVMPLIGHLDLPRMRQVQATMVRGIAEHRTRTAILDLTGVPSVSVEVADEIINVVQAAGFLGSRVIVTGLRPGVAQTLVDLGRDLSRVVTHRTLQSGVASAMRRR